MVSLNYPKFRLGQIVATPGALEALKEANQAPDEFLKKHMYGSWGDLCEEGKKANDQAVAHEGNMDEQQRVLSSYQTKKGVKIWIITEWDRSATTLLLPSEY